MHIKHDSPTSLVIAGSWNTAILNPGWFKKELVLPLPESVTVEFEFATNSIRFEVAGVLVHPRQDHLTFIAKSETKETYKQMVDLALGVVEKLHHTPIQAIGHNRTYELDDSENFVQAVSFDMSGMRDFYKFINNSNNQITVLNAKHTVEYDDTQLNISYQQDRRGNQISMNFHYAINKADGIPTAALEKFVSNLDGADEIVKHLVRNVS